MLNSKNVQTRPFELVWMPVVEFIKLKSFADQTHNGKSLIKMDRVNKLRTNVNRILTNPKLPIISTDNKIISGNHRRMALELEGKNLPFNVSTVIPVLKYSTRLTGALESVIAIDGNLAGNTSNTKTHLERSKTDTSIKVLKPAVESFRAIGLKLSGENAEHLGIRLGSVMNKNPKSLDALNSDRAIDISMIDLYNAKGNGDTNVKGLVDIQYDNADHVQIDLRPVVSKLSIAVFLAVKFINSLQASGLWKEKLGNNKMLMYYILELSLTKRLVDGGRSKAGKCSFKHFESVLRQNGAKVLKAASTINADAKNSRDTLEILFFS